MNKGKRIEWLDACKGIGIILVMLSHVSSFSSIGSYLFSAFIPLFYISSGIVSKKESLYKTLESKSRRLFIPYIFYGILTSLFFSIISNGDNYQGGTVYHWLGLLYSRFCLYPYGIDNNIYFLPFESSSPLWFLTSLLTGYIMFYFLNKEYCSKFYRAIILLIYLIITLFMANFPILLPWSIDLAFMAAIFLFIGKNLKEILLNNDMKISSNILFSTISLLAYVFIINNNGFVNLSLREYGNNQWGGVFMTFVSGILFTIAIMLLLKSISSQYYKFFSIVGRHSLRLMCIQMPILFILKKLIMELNFNLHLKIVVICVMFIAISFAVSYTLELLFNKYSNKISALKYL